VHFVSEDGRVPSSFMRALNYYALSHSGGLESKIPYPKDYESWIVQKPFEVLGYEGGPEVKVPVEATGEIGAILQAIACIQAKVYVPEKVPVREEPPDASGPEDNTGRRQRFKPKGYKPPKLLEIKPLPDLPEDGKFRLDVPLEKQPSYVRRGASTFNGLFVEDVQRALNDVVVQQSLDDKGRQIVSVQGPILDSSPVQLKGRTEEQFFQLPKGMWETMIEGEELSDTFVKYLLLLLRDHCADFAFSGAFANYGNPWLSVLLTFSNPRHLGYAMQKGLGDEMLAFFGCLWERYVGGMHSAVNVSHEALGWWNKLINRWNGKVVRPKRGQVNVAQSQLFKIRLFDIRAGFSNLMIIMEQNGTFSARAVAEIQKILPISKPVGNKIHDVVFRNKAESLESTRRVESQTDIMKRMKNRFERKEASGAGAFTEFG